MMSVTFGKTFYCIAAVQIGVCASQKRGTWWVLASPAAERYGMSIAKTRPRISPSSQNSFILYAPSFLHSPVV